MITHIFFDLDNTLYPKSSNLLKTVDEEITKFTASYLSISDDEAERMRRNRGDKYNTTYQWLGAVHGFEDIDAYLDAVHPKNLDPFLKKDPRLREMLLGLGRPVYVLTNAPMEHAVRVLKHLDVLDCFAKIFDLRQNAFIGKPDHAIMERNIKEAGGVPERSLLIDDMPGHVLSFVQMGGYGLVVDEDGSYKGPLNSIPSVLGLSKDFIDGLQGRRLADSGAKQA